MSRHALSFRRMNIPAGHFFKLLPTVFLLFSLPTACSPRQIMIKEMTGLMQGGVQQFEEDDDLVMLRQAIPAHIKLAEAMLVRSPKNRELMILLARLYGAYTFAFEEADYEKAFFENEAMASQRDNPQEIDQLKKDISRHYLKGAKYAMNVLDLKYPGIEKVMVKSVQRDQFFNKLDREDAPAIFWYGFNMMNYINRNLDSVKAMAIAPQAEAAMQKVIKLSPDYYHGMAHMVLMAFHASRPAMLGGKIETALVHYHTFKSIAGDDFSLADVIYARYCLPRQADRDTFEKVLNLTIETASESDGRYALFNQVAKERAQIYLKAMDVLFDE